MWISYKCGEHINLACVNLGTAADICIKFMRRVREKRPHSRKLASHNNAYLIGFAIMLVLAFINVLLFYLNHAVYRGIPWSPEKDVKGRCARLRAQGLVEQC
mgnify:CR=1 FL=1